jgi:hypothetical protein
MSRAVIWRIDEASPTFQARASIVGTVASRRTAERRANAHNRNAPRLGYPSRWVVLDEGETPPELHDSDEYELDAETTSYLQRTRSAGGGS